MASETNTATAHNRVNVRLTGSGGQGIALAATVLAEAALNSGLYATMLQEHGPEARGGATRADLSLSLYPIANPQFQVPDLCLVLSDKAWIRFGEKLVGKRGVGLIVDKDRVGLTGVSPSDQGDIIALPFEEMAKVKVGAKVVTNMICAASLARLIEAIPLEALSEVAERRSPPAFREKNRQATRLGWQMMGDYLESDAPSWRLSGDEVGKLAVVNNGSRDASKEGVRGSALSA